MRAAVLLSLLISLPCAMALAEDPFANRPAFSEAEQPARSPAECSAISSMSAGMPEPESRIDLSVVGTLSLVKTDGALWFLMM